MSERGQDSKLQSESGRGSDQKLGKADRDRSERTNIDVIAQLIRGFLSKTASGKTGAVQGAPSRAAQDGLAVHPGHGGLQSGSPAKAAGSGSMTPGVRPGSAGRAKKSLKMVVLMRKQC